MNRTLNLLLVFSLAVPAAAMDMGGRDKITDPDMQAEMQKVRESNLDNAMLRGLDDAGVAADYLKAFMFGVRVDLQRALKDISPLVREGAARPGSLEEKVDAILARSQRLKARALRFEADAKRAQLKIQDRDQRRLFSAANQYQAADRQADLRRAHAFIAEAGEKLGKVSLEADRERAVSSAEAFISEARSVRGDLVGALELLRAGKERPDYKMPLKRLETSLAVFDNRLTALNSERALLRAHLTLLQYDDAAFDKGL